VRLFQQEHEGSGLADAAADAEGNIVISDGLVVWEL